MAVPLPEESGGARDEHPGPLGRLGLAAVRAFAQAGWRVHAQVRPGASGPAIAGVQWLGVAPGDTAALAAWAPDAQVVVQGLSPVYTQRAWRLELPGLTQAAIDISRPASQACAPNVDTEPLP